MARVRLRKLYDVPSRRDSDGLIWKKQLSSLHFSGGSGWAVGSGQILHTNDARTWTNQISKVFLDGVTMPDRVFTIDKLRSWITLVAHRPQHNCYYTVDGGRDWKEKRIDGLVHPNDIVFANDCIGWIISDDGHVPAGQALIHKTVDGGSSWENWPIEMKGKAERLKFLSTNLGLLIQHSATEDLTRTVCNILRSRDGGHTWRVVKAFNRLITDVSMADEQHFCVVGEGAFIARTSDGGMNWSRTYTKKSGCLNVVETNGDGKAIAGGDAGLLLISQNAGEDWTTYSESGEFDNIIDVSFVENNRAVVATATSIYSLVFEGR